MVIHSEGNEDGQTDHMQHKTHMQDTNISTAVSLRENYERKWDVKDIFTNTNSVEHNRVFNPYTAGVNGLLKYLI